MQKLWPSNFVQILVLSFNPKIEKHGIKIWFFKNCYFVSHYNEGKEKENFYGKTKTK